VFLYWEDPVDSIDQEILGYNIEYSINNGTSWNVIPKPSITNFSPATGGSNTTVIITGINFSNASEINFGGKPAASFIVISDTSIAAVVGDGSSGPVSVTTPGGISTLGGFEFTTESPTPPTSPSEPSITNFSPATGGSNTTVIITGINFSNASEINFGGKPAASFIVISDTSIAAVVGNGSSGPVSVTTPGGISTLGGFEFTLGSYYSPSECASPLPPPSSFPNARSIIVKGLINKTPYIFRIAAINLAGIGPYSNNTDTIIPFKRFFINSSCYNECINGICPENFVCLDNICYPSCLDNLCEEGAICLEGKVCRPICQDGICPEGFVCVNNICEKLNAKMLFLQNKT
jgi:hypothetical protein